MVPTRWSRCRVPNTQQFPQCHTAHPLLCVHVDLKSMPKKWGHLPKRGPETVETTAAETTGHSHSQNAFDAVYSGCILFSAARDAPWRQLGRDPLHAWLIADDVVSHCTTCNGGVSDFAPCEA